MMRRTPKAAFASGMYVFPGGRVDDADHDPAYDMLHDGPDENQSAQRAALGDDWLGYWIAGIRETFEESGLLLAHDGEGNVVSFGERVAEFERYQHDLHEGAISLLDICKKENLRLAIDMIHFYNRWVTPEGRPRRFDTRFFITAAPPDQLASHDGAETVDSLWVSPGEALQRHADGDFEMMPVTTRQLEAFNAYSTATELVEMASANREFPTYRPQVPPGKR